MLALNYHDSRDVRVETVPDPLLVERDDLILRVTATAICGSDLHLYRGKIPDLRPGDILGHEFMGIVEEVGPDVTAVKPGDRVVIPFVVACGRCFHCVLQEFSACETTNTGKGAALNHKDMRPPAALFGFSHLYGGLSGGQAEYVRVPKANVGPLVVPDALHDEQVLFLSDILPTGYQAVVDAGVKQGSTVAIFGAGPVGLMAAACCRMLGAERIFMVDRHAYRLDFASRTYGVIPINFDEVDDPADVIVSQTDGRGVDASIEAVGFEAEGSAIETALTNLKLEGSSGVAIRQCIAATRRCGVVSVPGVYAGFIHAFMFGDAFDKGLTFKMGQTHVQKHMPHLLECIGNGQLKPSSIISHRMPLADAARGYELFDKKQDDCRKVVLTP
ncbi:zinc-dependent alcohol dehydrogenase [Xanthomonas euvesicatoria]|uniref:Threonine dehydrogenase-like Zn-dependent dehydrogenase n=1 Tax=Xanthomonas euvesicatoria TaxID=456327 RepID=A0AAW3U3W6_XANEU|nr:zinc-dependent alcohol dehydrogenase [Xanthomonas euvesicatoria]MBB4723735.1 threonine dehydrogenase-like Zn-dependent dehydrogenase [Xanthomonas euvesicatoria]MBB4870735.1 threonine dehydrogenase-like Zn-dependent dehydrogenase [Xanthomonas euvesicatoria]